MQKENIQNKIFESKKQSRSPWNLRLHLWISISSPFKNQCQNLLHLQLIQGTQPLKHFQLFRKTLAFQKVKRLFRMSASPRPFQERCAIIHACAHRHTKAFRSVTISMRKSNFWLHTFTTHLPVFHQDRCLFSCCHYTNSFWIWKLFFEIKKVFFSIQFTSISKA